MVKLTHLLILTTLIVWLAGSGCIGSNTSKSEGSDADVVKVVEGVSAENLDIGLTQAEIKELDDDMMDLNYLLENASLEEEISVDEVKMEKNWKGKELNQNEMK